MSSFDLSKVRQLAQEEVDAKNERNQGNSEGNKYPLVYPAQNGKLVVKLLYNVKSGTVQRKIVRHNGEKEKIPCLQQMYGVECPICVSINQVEQTLGKEMGAWRKYGYKARGICYAQIMDHEATYFNGEGDPQKGDIVLLMYPVSVYDEINRIIIDSGEHLEQLVAQNEGLPIVINRSLKGNGIPEYSTSVYPYGKMKSFGDSTEVIDGKTVIKTGDQKFEEVLNEIPNLNEAMGIPQYQDDTTIEKANALGETITQEYMGSKIVNPSESQGTQFSSEVPQNMFGGQNVNPQQVAQDEANKQAQAQAVVQTTTTQSIPDSTNVVSSVNEQVSNTVVATTRPACFGQHKDNEKNCLMCPMEDDCYNSMNK